MERTLTWWESLTDEQRADVLAMSPGPYAEWVLDSMAAAGVTLVLATIDGASTRPPPTVTSDFIRSKSKS